MPDEIESDRDETAANRVALLASAASDLDDVDVAALLQRCGQVPGVPSDATIGLPLVRRVHRDFQSAGSIVREARTRCATVTIAPATQKNTYASRFELKTNEVTPLMMIPIVASATTAAT